MLGKESKTLKLKVYSKLKTVFGYTEIRKQISIILWIFLLANSTPILHFSLPHVIGVDLLRRHEFTSYLKRKLKHYNNTV